MGAYIYHRGSGPPFQSRGDLDGHRDDRLGWTDGVSPLNTGGRYDPTSNTWTAISTLGAPSARVGHTITWTGLEMIVWGGDISSVIGARYRPSTNTWKTMTTTGSPSARINHTAVWTGTNVIVWGGSNGTTMGDGGQYTP